MRFAITIPCFEACSEPGTVARMARDVEVAGWDGFFVWDHIF